MRDVILCMTWVLFGVSVFVLIWFFSQENDLKANSRKETCMPYAVLAHFQNGEKEMVLCGDQSIREVK